MKLKELLNVISESHYIALETSRENYLGRNLEIGVTTMELNEKVEYISTTTTGEILIVTR